MSPRHVHAAAFTVLRIAHLGQAAALQVVATALEMALGRARLRRDRQQHQRCRQQDDKHSHDLAPFSP
jgi:aspartate aminotransferase-like enzyme